MSKVFIMGQEVEMIRERFNSEETEQDKHFFIMELEEEIKILYTRLKE